MKKSELRARQAPLKEKYKTNPEEGEYTLHVEGKLGEDIACFVPTDAGEAEAGLHPATGGDGSQACSGDMLLEALVACAGVTLKSVATAMEIEIGEGTVRAEGVLDFRGTLAVSKEAPVGFKSITLNFELNTAASGKRIEKLIELTERYCVIYQTLKNSPELNTSVTIQ
ncbi:peroxiredoxin [Aliifodinibius salipaludis]|uniref:Peroxiredoxin n=1 Tax=Fodinibius salipaludis TaxID=2032627 RepID=A0A2A2GE38_9BACT|nr:OsmC family protein [Aliifodinibius salipaludis]PAU95254.1 peroxiredoxin [Aliifodinibius salipaludis]